MSVAKRFHSEYSPFVFAWDSRKRVRKLIVETYKEGRKSTLTNEDRAQFDVLRKDVLPGMGFSNIFLSSGLEADDIIAMICKMYSGDKLIVSSDTDLYQLLDESTSMYKAGKKKIYALKDFKKEFQIEPSLWPLVKAIAGCSTDNVDGVAKGVGEKTAAKFLRREKISKVLLSKIRNGKKTVTKNIRLVALPFDSIFQIYPVYPDKLSRDAFELICMEYGFKVFLKEMNEWKKVFRMK